VDVSELHTQRASDAKRVGAVATFRTYIQNVVGSNPCLLIGHPDSHFLRFFFILSSLNATDCIKMNFHIHSSISFDAT
jgi:hypothetical protein